MTEHPGSPAKVPLRATLASAAGLAARRTSMLLGKGSGGMVGGKVALRLDPHIIQSLSAGKKTALVTGTNGKSTTTKMTAAAVSTIGSVAANLGGDNLLTGVTTALMLGKSDPFAVLEVDEMNLPAVTSKTHPDVLVLLNLSRDQLDRVGEIGAVEKRLRRAVYLVPDSVVVANCDDPLITSAAWEAPNVVWVAAGAPWKDDATSFPRTGTLVHRDGDQWCVEGDEGFRRPEPDWWIDSVDENGSFRLRGPSDFDQQICLSLPGRANRGNAAQAIAAAVAMGAKPKEAVRAVESIKGVAGRYQTFDISGRHANFLLAKNPAGWQESQGSVPPGTNQLVIAVNGQVPDGEDLSWLWDVDFTPVSELDGCRIIASGERVADLAVRLEYSGIAAEVIDDPYDAVLAFEPGPVQVLANYTAFRDLKKRVEGETHG